jgi:hypothetical protein
MGSVLEKSSKSFESVTRNTVNSYLPYFSKRCFVVIGLLKSRN